MNQADSVPCPPFELTALLFSVSSTYTPLLKIMKTVRGPDGVSEQNEGKTNGMFHVKLDFPIFLSLIL